MKTFTQQEIFAARGTYSKNHVFELLGNRESVTVADIVAMPIPREYVLSYLCHLASQRTARLFACDEAERVMGLAGWSDPRSIEAVRIARLYADGLASDEQLAAAWAAARVAEGIVLSYLCHLASQRTARLFACDEAERVMGLAGWSDPRSIEVVRIARLYADGLASDEQLAAAWAAARVAEGMAPVWAPVWAARAATWTARATLEAARAAARAAAWVVSEATLKAASEAAWDAEVERQIAALAQMIEEEK